MLSPHHCYVCGREMPPHHHFYEGLCPVCGEENLSKRRASADLSGYSAIVTGGRVKIGYETALKLLRCGANVIVTSRFEADTHLRFRQEPDWPNLESRLTVVACDFRLVSCVEDLLRRIEDEVDRLDILINNAAQTVRRPPAFYRHLLEGESDNAEAQALRPLQPAFGSALSAAGEMELLNTMTPLGIARLSMLSLIPGEETEYGPLFPKGHFDKDGQQEDRRDSNSWMMKLTDVPLVEFLEILYVNVVAPFLLCSRLRSKMKKSNEDKPSFVVNVSAMEGNFSDPEKNWRHPHTNMAKAALNMMTRTCASDFKEDRIFMNAVDPGWVTNERPFPLNCAVEDHRTKMAIDEIDGAARVCDPIFRALNANEYFYGQLFKNYAIHPW